MSWFSKIFKNSGQTPPSRLPGRNDACWCDSGQKYKKCHLPKDKLYFKEHTKKKVAKKKPRAPVFG